VIEKVQDRDLAYAIKDVRGVAMEQVVSSWGARTCQACRDVFFVFSAFCTGLIVTKIDDFNRAHRPGFTQYHYGGLLRMPSGAPLRRRRCDTGNA
jgi:hypothetical protein